MASAFVWLPVFVLFTRARFDVSGALLLGSLYYFFVVAVEVPSGWMSDRFGRVLTLRFAAIGFTAAQVCFLLGDDQFLVIVLGQFFLACGFAGLSGTDVSFHYDSLEALGLEDSYARRQARVSSIGFIAMALSAVLGGGLGVIDLRLTFVASLIFAMAQLAITFMLSEPPTTGQAAPIGQQLKDCVRYLNNRYIGWIFFYGVLLVTLEHVALELMQPWLTAVLGQTADDVGSTPLVAGLVFAVVAFVGAGAARVSAATAERFGAEPTMIGLAALSAVIVTGMALWVHWAVLILVVFRSAQGAAAPVLISAAITERTEQQHRATFLSINSLAGRLGFGLVLFIVASPAGDAVQPVLGWLAATSWVMVGLLMVTATVALKPPRATSRV